MCASELTAIPVNAKVLSAGHGIPLAPSRSPPWSAPSLICSLLTLDRSLGPDGGQRVPCPGPQIAVGSPILPPPPIHSALATSCYLFLKHDTPAAAPALAVLTLSARHSP